MSLLLLVTGLLGVFLAGMTLQAYKLTKKKSALIYVVFELSAGVYFIISVVGRASTISY